MWVSHYHILLTPKTLYPMHTTLDVGTDFPLTLLQMNRLRINLYIATCLLAALPMGISN